MLTLADMAGAGFISPEQASELAPVEQRYAVAVTPAMARLIDRAAIDDPIARQFIPDPRELKTHPAERDDPIGDHLKSPLPGLVHRYPDRVLLKLSGVCPVYCRFCFRREMVGPGAGTTLTDAEIAAAVAHIARTPAIWEVILTGGDPLILSPRRIRAVTEQLAAISHVKVLRWHTRVPVVTPERVTAAMVDALTATRQSVYIAIHANHPRELTADARASLARLADGGITLVSQSVLLRGVNDTVETLEALMRAFAEARVKPYYLHHGDLAPGTAHFRTALADGEALMTVLRTRVSGLAMPTYVLDLPGAHGKVPVNRGTVTRVGPGRYRITAPDGTQHVYEDAITPAASPAI